MSITAAQAELFQRAAPASEARIRKGFERLYAEQQLPAPEVLIFPNPRDFYRAVQQAASDPNGEKRGRVFNRRMWQFVGEKLAQAHLEKLESHQALRKHMEQMRPAAEELQAEVMRALKTEVLKKLTPIATHPHYFDQQWANYYFEEGLSNELLDDFLQILHAGLMFAQCYEKQVLACLLPKKINLNERGRLHNEKGPSLQWSGWSLYHWQGTAVPQKLIEQPQKITAEEVLRERNAERRRCYQEKLGSERFATLFNLKTIDEDLDLQGNRQYLLRTEHVDDLAGEHIQFARVTCPTTHRQYFLCVPPYLDNIWAAVAWTFGKLPEEYHPDSET